MLLGQKISDRVAGDARPAAGHRPAQRLPASGLDRPGRPRDQDRRSCARSPTGRSRSSSRSARRAPTTTSQLAVKAGADVIVLDGMQGGTAATQDVFIEHVGIPTLRGDPACGRGAAGARHAPRGAADRLRRHPHAAPTSPRRSRSAPTPCSIGVAALIALGDNSPELEAEYRKLGTARRLLRRLARGPRPGRHLDPGRRARRAPRPGARRPPARQLPARDDARVPDARARLRQVPRAQPRARGPRGADDRGRGDGEGAAGGHELDPGT